jgi:hypothetical protein
MNPGGSRRRDRRRLDNRVSDPPQCARLPSSAASLTLLIETRRTGAGTPGAASLL